MGYDRETTPTLDEMADEGLVFENVIAPGPSTSESMPAIFTGHYPYERTGVSDTIDERIGRIRPHMAARKTIAEQFSEAGYRTAAFTPNPFTTRYFGFEHGFDHFQDFLSGSRGRMYDSLINGLLGDTRAYMPIRVLFNWMQNEEVFKPWEAFYDEVVDWIRSGDDPYFLWVFLMDAHHPYLADAEHRSTSLAENVYANWKLRAQNCEPPFSDTVAENLVTAYDDSIEYADAFLKQLRRDTQDDDPVIVVTGDHGEAFGEHQTYEHHGGAFGEHGVQEYNSYLYEENIHVPLVVANADDQGAVERPFSLRSLIRLLDPSAGTVDVDGAATDEFVVSQTMDPDEMAVRGRRWKYLRDGDEEVVYDLENDEHEAVEADEPRHLLRSIADSRRASQRECQRIVNASETLTQNRL
jgi:arylsulfatase